MLDQWIGRLAQGFKVLSAACLGAMMLLTCADVIGRAVARPILGAIEVAGFLATLTLAFSLPDTHRARGHVGVEILTMRLGPRGRAVMEAFTGLLGLGLFGVITWRCFDYGAQMQAAGEVSMTLQFPVHYIIYFIAASFGVLTLVQLADVVRFLRTLFVGAEEAS